MRNSGLAQGLEKEANFSFQRILKLLIGIRLFAEM
jgi:hypothetical protein